MISWFVIVNQILGFLGNAVSLIKSAGGTTKRLLRPTYDIIQVRNKISDQSLSLGSRIKVYGRFSEFTPFVDMSKLLLSKLARKMDNLSKEKTAELVRCTQAGGIQLVHTCRLEQIKDFWPATLLLPEEINTASRYALPLFFDNSAVQLLQAQSGDIVEIEARISSLPSQLSQVLHPDPMYIYKRTDGMPIPIGLHVEAVRNISKLKKPFFTNLWLMGHYEPLTDTDICPFSRMYAPYIPDDKGNLFCCPPSTACAVKRETSEVPVKSVCDIEQSMKEEAFFFENLGNFLFRIIKDQVDLQNPSYRRNRELLKVPLVDSFGIVARLWEMQKRKFGQKKLEIDFQFDQRIPLEFNSIDTPIKAICRCDGKSLQDKSDLQKSPAEKKVVKKKTTKKK